MVVPRRLLGERRLCLLWPPPAQLPADSTHTTLCSSCPGPSGRLGWLAGFFGVGGRDEHQHVSPRGRSGCVLWEAWHPPSLKGSWEELLEALNFRAPRG